MSGRTKWIQSVENLFGKPQNLFDLRIPPVPNSQQELSAGTMTPKA
jgi:hypothetical protein